MAQSIDSSISRFSTAELPEKHRVALWREHYARLAMRLDIEPADDATFDCAVAARSLPGAQVLSATMSPLRVTRTHELVADGNDNLAFIINQSGFIDASLCGREVSLHAGDAVLMSSAEASVFDRRLRGDSLSVLFPRSELLSSVVDLDRAVMRRVPRNAGMLKLLTAYASSLMDEGLPQDRKVRHTITDHLRDLVALTLGATRDAANCATYRGLQVARLNTAKAYIRENSNRHDLSVGIVAAQVGVTRRVLQRLFEQDGSTFTEFLLVQRLERARGMLSRPDCYRRSIGQIGYDVGFNDLSYFHRAFKRHYGVTPLELKNEGA
jgi:AraC-like DNA-binding protein